MLKKVLTVMAAFLLITGFTIGCEPPEDPGYGEQPGQEEESGGQEQTAPGGGGGGGAEGF